jgi:hypothetical protein
MDEKDIAVSDRKLTEKEEKEFSDFLKSRKSPSAKDSPLKPVHQ